MCSNVVVLILQVQDLIIEFILQLPQADQIHPKTSFLLVASAMVVEARISYGRIPDLQQTC